MALALAVAVAGCKKEEDAPPKLPPVRVIAVAARAITPRIPLAGVLSPLPGRDVKVGALVAGRVDRVFVAEGDRVAAGQPLAHVEAETALQHLSETDAARETARATADNARTRLARAERLYKDGIAARQEVDDARAQLVAAESALKQAQAVGGIAQVQLDRSTLRAPIAGVVAAILVPAGQPVDGAGTPVVEVADTRVLDLRAPVPAARVGEVTVGQRALITVEGVGEIEGAVEAVAPLVDLATNTVIVRVRIDNRAGRVRGGQFARGALLCPTRKALAVPREALLPGDGGEATLVAIVQPDGTVTHRSLTLGGAGGVDAGEVVEVRAGLAGGERVIVEGGYALPDGTKVEVQ
jgi:RND family efflux transporter MFP subunit